MTYTCRGLDRDGEAAEVARPHRLTEPRTARSLSLGIPRVAGAYYVQGRRRAKRWEGRSRLMAEPERRDQLTARLGARVPRWAEAPALLQRVARLGGLEAR